uniref:Uncharacterized protein n=1 Tax=Mastacembelus armatus TaxID=205130 RepID=A0A3Q3MS92_9TELE
MADSRQPEDGAQQWDSSGGQDPAGTHGANGYSSSAYRTCQPGGAHMATATAYSARENGFNGELTGAHAITAEQVSARIVQEVTAEAVAVLKGEQETQSHLYPAPHFFEDTTNLPPSPPPSPAAEHFGPLEQAFMLVGFRGILQSRFLGHAPLLGAEPHIEAFSRKLEIPELLKTGLHSPFFRHQFLLKSCFRLLVIHLEPFKSVFSSSSLFISK